MVWSLKKSETLSDQQFSVWGDLLEERAGVCMGDTQRVFLQTQISMRMRELGINDYDQYFERITDGMNGNIEWTTLIDRLVVKETSFFRHQPSIEVVLKHLQRKLDDALEDSYQVWSVGCSTGEEPYSLAMAIDQEYTKRDITPYLGVIGTDISRAALTIAKTGVYPKRKVEQMELDLRESYFHQHLSGRYEVVPELKDRVCFHQANILELVDAPDMKQDVIFCQNVMIYFKKWLKHDVMNIFAERLKPGGLLIVGLGEVVEWQHQSVSRVAVGGVHAYQRAK